jgi:hypothetical protein
MKRTRRRVSASACGPGLVASATLVLAPAAGAAMDLPSRLPAAGATKQAMTARGGVPFDDWRVTSGALPPGLTLNRFTGALSGTPTAAVSFFFTVELRDDDRLSTPVTKAFQIVAG